jgi:hypothetical protein
MSIIQFPRKIDPLEHALLESLNRFDQAMKANSTPACIQQDVPIAAFAHALSKVGLAFTVVRGVIVIHTIRGGVL